MKKSEFETLAAVKKIDAVELREIAPSNFELWTQSPGFMGSEDFKTALGERRIWSSVDTALSFIRSMGYTGQVVINTPNFESKDEMEVMAAFHSQTTDYKIELVDEIKRELGKKNPNKPRAFTPDLLSKRELDEFMPTAACMTPTRLAQLRLFANNRAKKMIALTKTLKAVD